MEEWGGGKEGKNGWVKARMNKGRVKGREEEESKGGRSKGGRRGIRREGEREGGMQFCDST